MSSNLLPLSPVDHAFVGERSYSVEFLFKYNYRIDEKRLRTALLKAVKLFPPVSSKLVETPNGALSFCTGDEPVVLRFEKLKVSPNLEDPRALSEFSEEIKSVPGHRLASVYLAHTPEGSLLGLNISHCVVDGYSYFYFLKVLSELYQPSLASALDPVAWFKIKAMKPDLDRTVLCPVSTGDQGALCKSDFTINTVFERTGMAYSAKPRGTTDLAKLEWEFLDVSHEQVKHWHSEAHAKLASKLSIHDVLAAYLWQYVATRWDHVGDELACTNAFDYRRIHPSLGAKYFGNAIRGASLKMDRREVETAPLYVLAENVRKTTSSINLAAVEDSLRCLDEFRRVMGHDAFGHFHVSDPDHGFLVTNLSRVPIHSLNFGGGAPVEVVPLTPARRAAIILTSPQGYRIRLQAN